MKKIFIFSIFLLTFNCSTNKVSNIHGYRFLETKQEKIVLNKSNKNDVRKLIGPPSSISKFGDTWIYIERKKTNQSIYKLGIKRISKNNVLVVKFNNRGLVSEKNLLNFDNMNDLTTSDKKTIKKYKQDNFVYNILSSLRDKINAPTRRAK